MNIQSIIIGCFCLLILLFLIILHFGGEDIFLWSYITYNVEGEDIVWVQYPKLEYIFLLVSLPFSLLTFVVYSILPELQNMHGYTLRAHIASLFVTNAIDFCIDKFPITLTTRKSCLSLAYIYNFSSLSSLLWLNVICFDTWWTLRQLRSYRTNLKKREKKMFIKYSIYAWGIPFILNVVYAILDIPDISKHLGTPPEMCVKGFWFDSYDAKNLVLVKKLIYYYFIPVGVSVIVNICLFIAMVLTIWCHDKQTTNQLRNSRSSNDNKNKFTIYVTLSAVLGIDWIMKIILELTDSFMLYDQNNASLVKLLLWHITVIIELSQGVILFFAFVGKKNIMLLLLKRFGCQGSRSNILRNNDGPCTFPSPTTHHTAEMQEISPSNQQINHRVESYS